MGSPTPQQQSGARWVDLPGGVRFNSGILEQFHWPWNVPPQPTTANTRPPGNWEKVLDWPFEVHVNNDTVNQLTGGVSGLLRDIKDAVPQSFKDLLLDTENLKKLRDDWPRFAKRWGEILDRLQQVIANLKGGWIEWIIGPDIMGLAEDTVRHCKEMLLEAAEAPLALLDDIEMWLGKPGTEPGVQADANWLAGHTSLRSFDSAAQSAGLAAKMVWRGRVRDAYVSRFPEQTAATAQIPAFAARVVNALESCLTAAIAKYGAWATLAYQILAVLTRATVIALLMNPRKGLNTEVLMDSGEWVTLLRLKLNAEGLSAGAEFAISRQAQKLAVLLAERPGLKQADQMGPDSGRPDNLWPNPFNDVNYLRASLVKGKVRLEGGAELQINKGP